MTTATADKMYGPLAYVTTVSEAAHVWGYHRTTIQRAIDFGYVAAIKSGRTWLISVPSLVAHFGHPPTPKSDNPNLVKPGTATQIIPFLRKKSGGVCRK